MNAFRKLFEIKKMPLIMSLPANNVRWCRAAFEAGADAVKVHINLHHNAGGEELGDFESDRERFDSMASIANGRPMGIVPGASQDAILKDIEKVKFSAFDFVSFYAKYLPVRALPMKQCLMAACDASFTTEEVRAYEDLGAGVVEASVIPSVEYGTPLSFRDLVLYRMITSATRLPVVVPTQRAIAPEEVKYLYQAGVRGIMIGAVVTGKTEEGIVTKVSEFRKALDRL